MGKISYTYSFACSMIPIRHEEFESIVRAGIRAIPEKFLNLLDNVDVTVEEEPTEEQRRRMKLERGTTLLGLYEGVPRTKRGSGYSFVLPDKITVFKNPIEASARDLEHLKKIVADTIWHEFAHHFGIDEGRVRHLEGRRRR